MQEHGVEFTVNKCYSLRVLPLFEEDLNGIIDYIMGTLRNPIAAESFIKAVEDAIYDRLKCPESFEPYHSLRERRYPYYQINVKNYTIFYVVIGDVMEIRRILYSHRDWKSLI